MQVKQKMIDNFFAPALFLGPENKMLLDGNTEWILIVG
jgi:hypothetical protein